ncbi:MAG: sugar ABC transporter substrate-binding protein [Lachnospiraceae bacterium]|nr:sugar ABC transporter substrate-binding protein [Lachnospiraceae bacterium]
MKKRTLAAMLAASMIAGMMSGCGSSSDSSAASSAAEATSSAEEAATEETEEAPAEDTASGAKQIMVNVWDSKQQPGIQQICDEWTATSGIPVKVEVVDWDNYWTLLEAGATGGEMPDVFWMHSQYSEKYMDQGILLDLTDYIAKDDAIDLSNYYEEVTGLYAMDGKQYAVPKDYDTIALWYNKDMFDEAGIAYPDETWTWEKLIEVAQQLTKEDGSQYGFVGNTDANQEGYYNAIYSYGGYVINDAKDKSGYDDPATLEAMEMYTGLIKAMPPQSTMAESGNLSLFMSNTAAMGMFGSWYAASFKQMAEEGNTQWACAVLPYHDANGNGSCDEGERVSIFNGLGWSAPANVENPDDVYALISYLGSKEGQTRQAELGVTMSAYKGTSDAWVASIKEVDLTPYLDEAMGDAKLVPMPCSRNSAWAEDAKQSLVAAWQDTSKMTEVCKQIAADMNASLAE